MGFHVFYDKAYEIVSPYHQGKPQDMVVGQIAWVPVAYTDIKPRIMDLERVSPQNHDVVKFRLSPMRADHFQKKYDKLPVPAMPARESEEYILHKAKRRPCILLQKSVIEPDQKDANTAEHQLHSCHLFVPLYGVLAEGKTTGLAPEFVSRVQKLQYSHLFYVPPEHKMANSDDFGRPLKDSVARLDKLFACSPFVPMVAARDVKLNEDYLTLMNMLAREFYIHETLPALKEIREAVQ